MNKKFIVSGTVAFQTQGFILHDVVTKQFIVSTCIGAFENKEVTHPVYISMLLNYLRFGTYQKIYIKN